AMRGGMALEALCERYRVSLLAIPLYPTLEQQVPEFLPTLCENIAILQPRESALDQMRRAGEVYQGHQFDIVHVFRLAAMAFAQPYLRQVRGHGLLHLDLDDIESKANRRIA